MPVWEQKGGSSAFAPCAVDPCQDQTFQQAVSVGSEADPVSGAGFFLSLFLKIG